MRRLRGLADALRGTPAPVVHVSWYELPHASRADAKLLGKVGGVQSWIKIRGVSTTTLYVFWRSSEHFKLGSPAAQAAAGASSTSGDGMLGEVGMAQAPWWRQVKPATWLLSTAALLGALEVISNRYDRLFATPALSFRSDKPSLHFVEGEGIRTTLQLVNDTPTPHEEVVLTSQVLSPAGKAPPLSVTPTEVALLAGLGQKDVVLSGDRLAVGKYKFRVEANAKAGLLRQSRTFAVDVPVEVWSKVPQGSLALRDAQQGSAIIDGVLRIGPPARLGLDCEVQVDGLAALDYQGSFDLGVVHSAPRWSIAGSGGNRIGLLSWSVGAVPDSFQTLRFVVVFTGPRGMDWKSVVPAAKISCQYRREAYRHE